MSDDVETLVRHELDSVAARVTRRPEWTAAVLAGFESRRTRARRRTAAATLVAAAVVAVLLAAGVAGDDDRRPRPAPAPPDVERMVDVGGRSLSMSCSGTSPLGEPTVLLDNALGGAAESYADVRAAVAADLRVCTYDRAGTGDSHAARDFPRTARSVADDLARLVRAGDLGPSVVLVTDGFTALSGSVFAADNPDLVTGLVFLDPRGPHVSARQVSALGSRSPGEPRIVSDLRQSFAADALSLNGEQISWPASEAESAQVLDRPGPAFGDTPTVVLAPGLGRSQLPPLPGPIRSAWWDAVRADQELLAAESSRGRLRVVPNVAGALATSAPASVVAAIREVAGT